MFTGIIQQTGHIVGIEPGANDSRFVFDTGKADLSDINIGDSIAVNGACLTVTEKQEHTFTSDLSKETLALTTFSDLKTRARINLEKSMLLSDRINGHLVSGHIDGVGSVIALTEVGSSVCYSIEAPNNLARYIAKKGSIAIDGVSLTVNEIRHDRFSVNIIPHTLSATIISEYRPGTRVNIEVDLIARYLDTLVHAK